TMRSLLLAAAVMLGWRPSLAGDLSFQYSFLGVTGIQLLSAPVAGRLRWLPLVVREAFAVTTAAQAATLPLTAYYFHVVPLRPPPWHPSWFWAVRTAGCICGSSRCPAPLSW